MTIRYRPKSKYLFVKWFIVFALLVSASMVAAKLGLFTAILTSDISHLSTAIALLFIGTSLATGKLSFEVSRDNAVISDLTIKKRLMVLDWLADSFFVLGLLGTIIGFCYMMRGTLNANIDVSQIIQQLKVGSATKLFTTLSGITASLLLQFQLLLVKLDLKDEHSNF